MSRLRWILSRLRRTLWVRVSLYAVLGVVAAVAATLASWLPWPLPIYISAEAIDSLLNVIASSMLAVTTFSVTALTSAYGSATSNATPRATALLTEDEFIQSVLATFIGSFLFSVVGLVALRVSIYGPQGRALLFVTTVLVIVLIVLALLRWIHQLTKLGRVGDTLDRLEQATDRSIRARLDLPFLGGLPLPDDAPDGPAVLSDRVGYVQFIDTAALSKLCERHGLYLDILVLPGAFLYHGSPLAMIRDGSATEDIAAEIRDTFTVDSARSFDQDPRFGIIALTEVALRALSPAMNDPGTAIDVIGRQVRLLTLWAEGWHKAELQKAEYPRLRVPPLRYDDIFDDAFRLIARDAAGQIDVLTRVLKALDALTRTGPEAARQAAAAQLGIACARGLDGLPPPDQDRLRQVLNDLDGDQSAA
ncbi:DUF2254 domain-containing protein [Paracoccus sediminis]|uniref:DUF2254 domain-containing protein n=1 Tax=Paracoccus sediminis TaxID=1214787 RepID=A0A238X5P5_9RHOB|nr:DUF2254 domain-containing protein [Paracoccus sediminis]TBN49020.1 DUF2254 domain-containing protein [Paracoccus sediminis]SNR54227.1 Uncharacterized membrane protein [Paracoccus sediminis]